jgi:predicted alpha/beta-fold hydrolase
LTAADDPIIPVEDLHVFRGVSKQLRLIIVPHGGHVGYVTFPLQFWLTEFVESVLAG